MVNLFIGKGERKSKGRWQQWATQWKASKVRKPKWWVNHGNLAVGEDSHNIINSNCDTEVANRRSRDLPERKLWSNSWGGKEKKHRQNIIATTIKHYQQNGKFGTEICTQTILFIEVTHVTQLKPQWTIVCNSSRLFLSNVTTLTFPRI